MLCFRQHLAGSQSCAVMLCVWGAVLPDACALLAWALQHNLHTSSCKQSLQHCIHEMPRQQSCDSYIPMPHQVAGSKGDDQIT